MTPPDQLSGERERLCVRERNDVLHIVDGAGDDTFQPIRCGRLNGEGIVMPGPSYKTEPTCPECITLAQSDALDEEQRNP